MDRSFLLLSIAFTFAAAKSLIIISISIGSGKCSFLFCVIWFASDDEKKFKVSNLQSAVAFDSDVDIDYDFDYDEEYPQMYGGDSIDDETYMWVTGFLNVLNLSIQ